MKCKEDFICANCNKKYHSISSNEQRLLEHNDRKVNIPGYAEYGDENLVQICDHCFKKIMHFD